MLLNLNYIIWKLFGRFWKCSINLVQNDMYEAMADDDFVDIKNFHRMEIGSVAYREQRKILKQRERWYVRHGFLDLAEDINTAIWVMEKSHSFTELW